MSTRYELGVKGMMCVNCAGKVRTGLQSIEGIEDISINIISDKVSFVAHDPSVLEKAIEFFNSLKYVITYQKTHRLNTPENQRTLALYYSLQHRSEIEKTFQSTSHHLAFQDNVLEITYDTLFFRGEDILKQLSEKNIGYEIIVKELLTKKVGDFTESFSLRDTAISFCLNILITFLVFGLPSLVDENLLIYPKSFGVLSYYCLTVTGMSSFLVFRYGIKIVKTAFTNYIRHRILNMFTLIALGVISAYSFAVYNIIKGVISNSTSQQIQKEMLLMDMYCINEMMQTAGTILAAVMFGKYLEDRAKRAINREIKTLEPRMEDHLREVELYVPKNKKFDSLKIQKLHPSLIERDDLIRVQAGSLIPFDGVIVKGEIQIIENIKFGRDTKETKGLGDLIASGSEVVFGEAIMQVNQTLEKSLLFKLYSQIQESTARVHPEEHQSSLLNNLIKYFIPFVLVASLFTLIGWFVFIEAGLVSEGGLTPVYSFERALSVLVASCPCALGLAIPIVFSVGLNMALKKGILIKDGNFLLMANKIDCLLLDKTGTITGKFNMQSYESFGNYDEGLLWQVVKAIEKEFLLHPIAAFLYQEAVNKLNRMEMKGKSFSLSKDSLTYQPAEGIIGKKIQIDGEEVDILLGNSTLIMNAGLDAPESPSKDCDSARSESFSLQHSSTIWLYIGGKPGLKMNVQQTCSIRDNVPGLIEYYRRQRKAVYIVTGDTKEAALESARQIGLGPEAVKYECDPEQKRQFVLELQQKGNRVMMVGDGLNDLLAFQAADLSVAINYKSEKNLVAADVILLDNDISKLGNLLILSKWSERMKNLSLFFAFCYNIVLIPSAMGLIKLLFGYELAPSHACWAMAISSLVVLTISNSLRLVSIEFDALDFKQLTKFAGKVLKGIDESTSGIDISNITSLNFVKGDTSAKIETRYLELAEV